MTSEWLFNSFIPPKNLYPPKQISVYAPVTGASWDKDELIWVKGHIIAGIGIQY